eukprot:scaffold96944_cov26-Tisochrysis_lutea.AAC.2
MGAPRGRKSIIGTASVSCGIRLTGERVSWRAKKSKRSEAISVCSSKVGRMRGRRRLAHPKKMAPPPPFPT